MTHKKFVQGREPYSAPELTAIEIMLGAVLMQSGGFGEEGVAGASGVYSEEGDF